jgi:predicted ArsR family transcriptional regulator
VEPGGILMGMPESATVTERRQAVLDIVKRHPGCTAEAVAEGLGITVSGARQQLTALARIGLLTSTSDAEGGAPAGRGRPQLRYAVTPDGDRLFPRAYGDLANELLGYLERDDPGHVAGLFADRRDHRTERAQARLAGLDLDDRVAELARILDEDGYLAAFERVDDGSFRITEHNCAILDVARHHPGACASEIEFLRAVLPDATVERVTHIIDGAHACSYEVRPV